MFIQRFLATFVLFILWFCSAGFTGIPASQAARTVAPAAGLEGLVVLAAPDSFDKSEPANNAAAVNPTVTLKWDASPTPGATYEYCLWTKSNCPVGKYKAVGESTSVSLTLQPGMTYYWQVRAQMSDKTYTYANGGMWKFTTVTAAPASFDKLSPGNTATNQPIDVTLTWEASPGLKVSYTVCYDTNSNPGCDTSWSQPITGTSTTITGLDYDTLYYWQVRASNASGTVYANNGTWWTFTTQIAPPGSFAKAAPLPDDINLPLNTSLSWSLSAGSGISYSYCLDQEALNDSACDSGWVSVNTATTALPAGLALNKTYSWQVRASNSSGTVEADGGTWRVFSTLPEPPTGFQKFNPRDGAVNLSLTPTLYWSTSAGSGVSYEYCLKPYALGVACGEADFVSAGSSTTLVVSPALQRNQEYIWQVRARDKFDQIQYADAAGMAGWRFTTLPDLPVIDAAKLSFSAFEDQTFTASVSATTTSGRSLVYALHGREPAGQFFLLGADGAFAYTPEPDFNGQVTFAFTVWDGVNPPLAPATVTIDVMPVNDKPVFVGDFKEVKVYTLDYLPESDIYLFFETLDADLPYGDTAEITLVDGVVPTTAGAALNILTDPASGITSAEFVWPAAVWSPLHPQPYSFTLRVTDLEGQYSEATFVIGITPERVFLPHLVR